MTGHAAQPTGSLSPQVQAGRSPVLDAAQLEVLRRYLFLETSGPRVFAVGDVRSGSVKRAATAIGEGSMAVRLVFERLTPKEPPP